jgi:hypothetical protein
MGRMKEKFLNNLENETELYNWRSDGQQEEHREHRSNRKGRRRTRIIIHKTRVVASPELTQTDAQPCASNSYEGKGVE